MIQPYATMPKGPVSDTVAKNRRRNALVTGRPGHRNSETK